MLSQNPVLAAAVCYCPCEHQSQQTGSIPAHFSTAPASCTPGAQLSALLHLQQPERCLCKAPCAARTPRSSSGCWMATSNSSTPCCNWITAGALPAHSTVCHRQIHHLNCKTPQPRWPPLMVSPGCSVSLTLLFNINRFKCVKGKMYKITYLNCTLTVSSNKHVGLLEKKKKKKRYYQNLPLLFSPTYFLDEATEKLFLS